ncbi:hypothetical protein MHL30_13175 [Priestia flexa]|uniref:hypothetical protein n=1 Tax=Priestia flexa TaxID=86664 RepID=UPI001EF49B70|nr:hypothetical protein [Priestia flexa]MCG7314114.1 hypothetical protein [Priestia flexa]
MQHVENPIVTDVEKDPQIYGIDVAGNEVFVGEEIFQANEEFILAEVVTKEVEEFFKALGIEKVVAK